MDWFDFGFKFFACFCVSPIVGLALAGIYVSSRYYSELIASDPERRDHLAVAFPAMVDDGLLFLVIGGLGIVGIGSGTQLLDEDPRTLYFIGYHVVAAFLAFILARMLCSGYLFHLFVSLGISSRFGIMGIIAFHFYMPHLEPIAILVAPLFTVGLLSSHHMSHYIRRFLVHIGCRPGFGANHFCPSHHTCLESIATVGFQLTAFGTGLLGVGTWAKLADKSPHLHALLAIYTGCAFWFFYGAKILGRGVVFEIFVVAGTVAEIGMFLTSALYVLFPLPDYQLPVFTVSFLVATLSLEWCRLQDFMESRFPERE